VTKAFRKDLDRRAARVRHDAGDLRPYQTNTIIPFMVAHPYSGVFVDMGLGKTISSLTVANELLERDLGSRILIIAPLRVAVQTWPTEISQWEHTWWMRPTLIRPEMHGTTTLQRELQKRRLASTPNSIHIINREATKWLVDFHGKNWPYDVVIVDESTSFADHRTQRWKALNSVRGKIKRLHLLSGIPAPEGIEQFFAQVYLLDRGERFGKSITAFRERFLINNPYKRTWTARPGADKEVAALIAPISLIMREEDYLDLAKPIVVERPIVLEPDELRQYRKFERDLVLQIDDVEIEAESGAALAQKLLQYASGAVYDAEHQWHVAHDHKLEELRQIVEEAQGTPLLVAYWHRSSLARLAKAFPKAVKMDREGTCVDAWNAGKIDMLLVHPRSAGHGLNMQLGPGHTLIFFDNPLPLENYLQTIARLARSGQKRVVKVFHLVTLGTLDATVVPVLRGKDDAQDTVRKYIRDLRKEWTDRHGLQGGVRPEIETVSVARDHARKDRRLSFA